MKDRIKHLLLLIVLVGIDQVTKLWVKNYFNGADGVGKSPIVILKDILNIQYHENTGAAWGIMGDKTLYLTIFTLIVLGFLVYLYFKIPVDKKHNVLRILAIFIIAGAIGNLIDRIYLGYVVDFIYFEIIDFPLFNFADSCLTLSSVILLLLSIFYYKDEDFEFLDHLFGRKKAVAVQDAKAEAMDDISDTEAADDNSLVADDKDTTQDKENSEDDITNNK